MPVEVPRGPMGTADSSRGFLWILAIPAGAGEKVMLGSSVTLRNSWEAVSIQDFLGECVRSP